MCKEIKLPQNFENWNKLYELAKPIFETGASSIILEGKRYSTENIVLTELEILREVLKEKESNSKYDLTQLELRHIHYCLRQNSYTSTSLDPENYSKLIDKVWQNIKNKY